MNEFPNPLTEMLQQALTDFPVVLMLAEEALVRWQGLVQPQEGDVYFKLTGVLEKKGFTACVEKGIQLKNRKEIEIIKTSGVDLLLKIDFLNPQSFSHIYEHNLAFFL